MDTSYLRDHAETRGFMLGRPVKARPTPDGGAVLFLRAQPRVATLRLYEFDVATGATREIATPEQILGAAAEDLSPEEKARRERQRISVGGFTDFQLSEDGELVLVSLSGKLYVIRRSDRSIQKLNTGPGVILDPRFAPDGRRVAYVRDHDVHVLDLTTREERRITQGGSEPLTHGLAEFVAQEEMGRFSGYWWSPDGHSIAYEEADSRDVEIWHVADPAHPEQPAHASYYPRPGKANVKARLGIVPATGGETVWVSWNAERYPYLGQVRWDKDGPLTIVVQTRDQKELLLLKADPATGRTTRLLAERDPAWVCLEYDVPHWLAEGQGFLWISEREGGPQLEHRNAEGKLVSVLVPRDQGLIAGPRTEPHRAPPGLADVDWPSGSLVVRASPDPTQSRLYRLSIATGETTPLGDSPGVHSPGIHGAVFAKNHSVYVEQSTTLTAMPRTVVRRADGTAVGELPSVAEEPPFVPNTEILKIGDGAGFYAAVTRPRDFDPNQRYPVIVNVYGGPGHLHVLRAMGGQLLPQWLADQGFVVVAIDGRGTPGRGRDWERAISRHFGTVPLDDQVTGLKAVGRRLPQLDLDRVGIVGWSFGGYLSALAVLKRPDIYKAAVAGAPVVDWLDYDTHYTERYLGLPDTDREAYEEGSLLTYAANLSRPLLLVHGTADDNVFFRHTLRLADALFRAGKHFEVLPLSGLTHMVPEPLVMERQWTRIAGHFQRHLVKPRP
ncbi:MAG TPA: S9 family peptidase [Pirellulales bacterium]|nr:S9 family peptidase [Pirellulales bacterium]